MKRSVTKFCEQATSTLSKLSCFRITNFIPYTQRFFYKPNVSYPIQSHNPHEKVDYIKKNPNSITNMYAESNLAEFEIFGKSSGSHNKFINFGIWNKSTSFKGLNDDEQYDVREAASKKLYDEVLKKAAIKKNSVVVDLGCGPGGGTLYIRQKCSPKLVIGIDPVREQVSRANRFLEQSDISDKNSVKFLEGCSDKLPLEDNSVTHLLCVEAVQHFSSIEKFIEEAKRVLTPDGKLVFASFFAKNKEGLDTVQNMIPDHEVHCSAYTIVDLLEILNSMKDVSITSIGGRVFPGFRSWIINVGLKDQWTMYWPFFYDVNKVDYFICEATNYSNESEFSSKNYVISGEEAWQNKATYKSSMVSY
jgi:SAM-dependent methyltransferase